MNVYFISGLGTDSRIFKKIQLPPVYTIHYIPWINFLPHESMHHYAGRMVAAIDTTAPFALVGLSLGGMIASEMNDFVIPVKTILISSAASSKELPLLFKIAAALHLNKLVPIHILRRPNPVLYWLFGIHTKEEKIMFNGILRDSDPALVRASIAAILTWKKKEKPPNLIHIHGTADRLLPIGNSDTDIAIKGGRHMMVFSKAQEVSAVLADVLAWNFKGSENE